MSMLSSESTVGRECAARDTKVCGAGAAPSLSRSPEHARAASWQAQPANLAAKGLHLLH